MKNSKKKTVVLSIIGALFAVIAVAFICQVGLGGKYTEKNGKYKHLKTSSSYSHIYNHPLWEGNGKEFFSCWADDEIADLTGFMSVKALCYWCDWDADTTIDALNYMIDRKNEGKISVHNVYSDAEIAQHEYLKTTKMIFLKGEPDMPVAIIAAGGGYTSVRSDTEGFPYAWKLNSKGYNVFVLRYRVGQDLYAAGNDDIVAEAGKDMIAAIRYIQANSEKLGVSLDGYSLWGSSAGGGLISSFSFACRGESFEQLGIPKPAAQMLIYTHADYFDKLTFQPDDVATFTIVGSGDTYGGDKVMDGKVPEMKKANMIVEYHKYDDYAHGSGLGTGTSAEGWIDEAVDFWKNQVS